MDAPVCPDCRSNIHVSREPSLDKGGPDEWYCAKCDYAWVDESVPDMVSHFDLSIPSGAALSWFFTLILSGAALILYLLTQR